MVEINNRTGYVGSYLKPIDSYVLSFVEALKYDLNNCKSQANNIEQFHNAMVLYTLHMLLFATGHRAVKDPFFDLMAFDLEAGTVLIEDKVVTSTHQTRLTWLPELVVKQINQYILHLISLARFIRKKQFKFSEQIIATTDSELPHVIPFFFLLESKEEELTWLHIKPSELKARLANQWQLPQNTNRHLLSSWLHSNGCPSELIDAQLGHIEVGCAPFSAQSVLNPIEVGHQIRPFLNRYLLEQGWSQISGLQAPSRLPIVWPFKRAKHLKITQSFGPIQREKIKETLWLKDSALVNDLVNKIYEKAERASIKLPVVIQDDEIAELNKKLMADTAGGRVLVRLTLMRRCLLKLKRQGVIVKVVGRLAYGPREISYFDQQVNYHAQKVSVIQHNFIMHLQRQSDQSLNLELRFAEIIISAILYGSQLSDDFINHLSLSIFKNLNRVNGHLSVDVPLESGNVKRWFPDQLSKMLIEGLWKIFGQNNVIIETQKALTQLDELLKAIGAPTLKKRSAKTTFSQLVSPLTDLSKAYWRLRLPSVLQFYSLGELNCASISLSNWQRLCTGERGHLEHGRATTEINSEIDYTILIRSIAPKNIDYKQAKQSWSRITKALGTDKESIAETDTVKENRVARSNARKKVIISRIIKILNDDTQELSIIAALIAAWAIYLCEHGTTNYPMLRANTVVTYCRTIGERLIALSFEFEFLKLSDLMIEDIYKNLLETVPKKSITYTLERLKEFHRYLTKVYAMPEIDWAEVTPDDLPDAGKPVDAAIVTLDEYAQTLDILLNNRVRDERASLLEAALLILAYRFGLRTGEVFRLTISDVLITQRQMLIYVRNSIYGETKTDNGIRQLPLIGRLNEKEADVMNRWLSFVENYADGDDLATILPNGSIQREVVDRSATVSSVVSALRIATGDSNMRLRHLRHTCATRLFLAMCFDRLPVGMVGKVYRALWGSIRPKFVRHVLTEDIRISRRGLYALAMYMGHSSPDVSMRHYVHLADIVLTNMVDQYSPVLSDKLLAYALQHSYESMRQIKSRKKLLDQSALIQFLNKDSTIPTPHLVNKITDNMLCHSVNSAFDTPILKPSDIDRILSIATFRDSFEGIADCFLTTDQHIIKIVQIATILQDKTGFTAFALPIDSYETEWFPMKITRLITLDKEATRIRQFLNNLDYTSENIGKIVNGCHSWIEAYNPNSLSLLITKRKDFDQLLAFYELLNIEKSNIKLLFNLIKNSEIAWKIHEDLKQLNISLKFSTRIPDSHTKSRNVKVLSMIVDSGKVNPVGYQQSLNRAIFILAVWLNFQCKLSVF